MQNQIVTLGPNEQSVRLPGGEVVHPPTGWILIPPGDAALTRRLKAATPTWSVQEKRGRKIFSHGTWASQEVVAAIRADLAVERATPQYAKKRAADARRRECQQTEYVADFQSSVLAYLAFTPEYAGLATRLAEAVAAHATPVGSGTVARTERIPIESRAEAAVIAWLRHQTTAYESIAIARVKGKRREVRRMLARHSHALLDSYRRGMPVVPEECPLRRALEGADDQMHERQPGSSEV